MINLLRFVVVMWTEKGKMRKKQYTYILFK